MRYHFLVGLLCHVLFTSTAGFVIQPAMRGVQATCRAIEAAAVTALETEEATQAAPEESTPAAPEESTPAAPEATTPAAPEATTTTAPQTDVSTPPSASAPSTATLETELLRLCALTDRAQRCTPEQREAILDVIEQLERVAPDADADAINGEWRLLAACGETTYRSSPFFWAFRQAAARLTTPVPIPGADVPAGGSFASAVYGITDAIPFYDIGPVVQRFAADGTFESAVELRIGRNFGLPAAKSLMTTSGRVGGAPSSSASASEVCVELRVERTAAKQSSIAALLPSLDGLLAFPTGDALDALAPGSSRVLLKSTFLSSTLRISRPVLDLAAAPASATAADGEGAVFVYARSAP